MASRIDTQFYVPRLPVAITALPSSVGSTAIRAMLELLTCTVHVHWIGAPTDFVQVVAQGHSVPRYLVIEGHGAEEGFYFGEFAPPVDTTMLRGAYMLASVVQCHVNLPACTVLALTCNGGDPAMARAFLAGGVATYIGCRGEPDAAATYVFLTNFFHTLLGKQVSDHHAWQRALAATDHPDIYQFSYFHGDGTEEQYKGDGDARCSAYIWFTPLKRSYSIQVTLTEQDTSSSRLTDDVIGWLPMPSSKQRIQLTIDQREPLTRTINASTTVQARWYDSSSGVSTSVDLR